MESNMDKTKITLTAGILEDYKKIMRELNMLHLRHMIEGIAQDPEKTFNLVDTPLKGVSPAEINSALEETRLVRKRVLV